MKQQFPQQFAWSDEATFYSWTSKSPPLFFNFLPLSIITFNIKKTTISLLIVNSNELNHKDQKKKKKTTCCHRLLHITTTIEEGDNISTITFFTAKPPKKVQVTIFLQQSHRKRWRKLLSSSFSLQWNHKRRWRLVAVAFCISTN